jgi:glycine/D-amino acid oxidase-like deaminating enzyme
VDALEGYRSTLREKRRDSIPIYSLMVVTEVLPEELLNEMGLEPGITFADYRNLVIYGQRTKDNRIAFGGRGAPYHFGSSIKPGYDRNDRIHDQIEGVLLDLFPQLSTVKFEQRWGGALGVSRDWMASVRLDPKSKLGQAGGYVGDGVGTSNLAGRTMADLILGLSTPLTKLCWVQHQSPKWEFEPLRFIAARGALLGADIADQIEGVTGKRSLISKIIARLTGKG